MLVTEVETARGSNGGGSSQLLSLSKLQELFMVFILSFKSKVMPSLHSF